MIVYLVVGPVDYEPGYLFGVYNNEMQAKNRLREAKASEDTYADDYYIMELILNEGTEEHI